MDMQMPVMDGLTATRQLRQNPAWAQLPVLAMTANAMSRDRDLCLAAGMNGHLAKPIDPDELFASLLQWIAPRAPASAPLGEAAPPAALPPEVADAADPLRSIEGLDTAAGLRRVLDKRPAYESLLRKFVAGQAGAVQATRAAMAAGQHDEALRAMHTLKGTAGTIGAAPLAKLAAAAEEAIGQKAPATTIDTLLNPVDAACQALVAALRTALPPEDEAGAATAAAAPHAPIDAAAAQQLLAQLDALLADDDSDAIELFKESTPALKALLGPAYAGMKRALDGYDFVEALAALRATRIPGMHNKEDPVHE
jgi:two-component system sensor histidine kinase/response regulator